MLQQRDIEKFFRYKERGEGLKITGPKRPKRAVARKKEL